MRIEHVAMYVCDLERAHDFFVIFFDGKANCGYLAACILTESEFERIENPDSYRTMKLPIKGIKKISHLKNIDTEAYAQMVKSFQMLQKEGLFLESIDL